MLTRDAKVCMRQSMLQASAEIIEGGNVATRH